MSFSYNDDQQKTIESLNNAIQQYELVLQRITVEFQALQKKCHSDPLQLQNEMNECVRENRSLLASLEVMQQIN